MIEKLGLQHEERGEDAAACLPIVPAPRVDPFARLTTACTLSNHRRKRLTHTLPFTYHTNLHVDTM
jgi:hypothetical protein